jgi:hypothetical protein
MCPVAPTAMPALTLHETYTSPDTKAELLDGARR